MHGTMFPEHVTIFEVGPRDGLQNEPTFIPTDKKEQLVKKLIDAGCKKIEVSSFVHPRWVPQLKDAKELFARIGKTEGVIFNALIPNMRGLEMAIDAGLDEVVTIMSSSESHNQKNLNMGVRESLKKIEEINKTAKKHNIRVRSYIATSFGCPMEGDIDPLKVSDIAQALIGSGSYEISLGDTTGMADPLLTRKVIGAVKKEISLHQIAVHFHRSAGIEMACNLVSLEEGITTFDSAVGGMGGCPYAPGSTGNCASETLVDFFARMNISTGIDLQKMRECSDFALSLASDSRQPKLSQRI